MSKKLSLILILAFFLINLPINVQAETTIEAGDLVKTADSTSVYYIGADSQRHAFPNQKTFDTWYTSFYSVKTITLEQLQQYSLGKNITYRPGTKLVKIQTSPKVYAVEPNATLRWLSSEDIIKTLYGSDWAKKIEDVPDTFFTNYTFGLDITTATYPNGTLISYQGATGIYLIENGLKRNISGTAFADNNFRLEFVQTAPTTNTYNNGSTIYTKDSIYSNPILTSVDLTEIASRKTQSQTGTGSTTTTNTTPTTITYPTVTNPYIKYLNLVVRSLSVDEFEYSENLKTRRELGLVELSNTSDYDITLSSISFEQIGTAHASEYAELAFGDYTGSLSGTTITFNLTGLIIPAKNLKRFYVTGILRPVQSETFQLKLVSAGSIVAKLDSDQQFTATGDFPILLSHIRINPRADIAVTFNSTNTTLVKGLFNSIGSFNLSNCLIGDVDFQTVTFTIHEINSTNAVNSIYFGDTMKTNINNTFTFSGSAQSFCGDVPIKIALKNDFTYGPSPQIYITMDSATAIYDDGKGAVFFGLPATTPILTITP